MSDFKVLNTRRLQIFELNHFMADEYAAIFDGVAFTSLEGGQVTQYSFAQAVKLFNEYEGKEDIGLMCKEVKLHLCKKKKKIICTNHLVRLPEDVVDFVQQDGGKVEDFLRTMMNVIRLR